MGQAELKVVRAFPQKVIDSFRPLFALPEDNLRKINEWARANPEFFLTTSFNQTAVPENLGVPRDTLLSGFALIATFVFASDPKEQLSVQGFIDALKQRGLGDPAEKAGFLLEGIRFNEKDVEFAKQRALAIQSVIATLEGADIICDLRGIFLRFPSPSVTESHQRNVTSLMGFEPVALVSLTLNDASGRNSVTSFQATEANLRNLRITLDQAMAQIRIIREKSQALQTGKGEMAK